MSIDKCRRRTPRLIAAAAAAVGLAALTLPLAPAQAQVPYLGIDMGNGFGIGIGAPPSAYGMRVESPLTPFYYAPAPYYPYYWW
jgi:hypothetical protein